MVYYCGHCNYIGHMSWDVSNHIKHMHTALKKFVDKKREVDVFKVQGNKKADRKLEEDAYMDIFILCILFERMKINHD